MTEQYSCFLHGDHAEAECPKCHPSSKERSTAVPTAEEYTLLREAYAETYPVRPLLNAIDAKDAEIERLRDGLRRLAGDRSDGPTRRIAQAILDGSPDETTSVTTKGD